MAPLLRRVSPNKLTYAVAMDGVRHLVARSLSELEGELDTSRFFRVNCQLLVAAQAVRRYSPAGKGRLKVTVEPGVAEEVFASQERPADFKSGLQAAPMG